MLALATFHAGGIMMSSLVGRVCPQDKTSSAMVHVYTTQEPRLFCGLLSLSPKLMSRTRFVMQALYQCSIRDKYHNSMAYAYAGVELRSWLFFSLHVLQSVAKSIP